MKRIICFFLLFVCMSVSAQNVPDTAEFAAAEAYLLAARKSMVDNNLALNPVTDFDCADPSVVKIGDWFYCFALSKCRTNYEERKEHAKACHFLHVYHSNDYLKLNNIL